MPLYVEDDLDVRIGPFELDNSTLQLALVIAIIRGVRVMRENGPRQTEQQENDGERCPVHGHCSEMLQT